MKITRPTSGRCWKINSSRSWTLLLAGSGVLKNGSAILDRGCYTSWGGYFLMEALARENGVTVNGW